MFQGKLTNFGITVCWPLNGPTEFKNARKICPLTRIARKNYTGARLRVLATFLLLLGFSSDSRRIVAQVVETSLLLASVFL